MLAVFSGEMVDPPPELVAAGSRTPSPKTRGSELVTRFLRSSEPAVSLQIGSFAHLAYSHAHQSPFRPRLFAAKDDIFCIFEGVLDNLGSLRHHYGLSKGANEAMLLIEAYKTLRDRAPHPTNFMLGHLNGNFSFVIFDKATSTLLVSSDPEGKVPLYWGITSDGCTAFCNDVDLLKGSCGKSLAPFPRGCFYSNKLGGLKSYEKPKNKVTAKLANDEELCGATFQVEEGSVAMETC
ncbi:stem-specific protein TSJT1-like [Asparagus officinalis]|uniref:stem-specific protein TSJT1-like n=1 Tax=Asparagus officinalis TaxID=4686 RepID=UPI00098E1371|nr:stem-specific protein TSJT1-like [Asparagus officinalis]